MVTEFQIIMKAVPHLAASGIYLLDNKPYFPQ